MRPSCFEGAPDIGREPLSLRDDRVDVVCISDYLSPPVEHEMKAQGEDWSR